MKLTAIVAMTPDRVIGKEGTMPWHLPEDLKLFKSHTTGHPIVMGRKTWDSIGFPLPKRQSIVLTHDTSWKADGATVIHQPEDLIDPTSPLRKNLISPHVFIIGGAQIYQTFMPQIDEILVSHIYEKFDGDTFFPPFESEFPHVSVEQTFDSFELRRYRRSKN